VTVPPRRRRRHRRRPANDADRHDPNLVSPPLEKGLYSYTIVRPLEKRMGPTSSVSTRSFCSPARPRPWISTPPSRRRRPRAPLGISEVGSSEGAEVKKPSRPVHLRRQDQTDLKPGQEGEGLAADPADDAGTDDRAPAHGDPRSVRAAARQALPTNKILSFAAKANEKGEIPFSFTVDASRKEVRTDVHRQPRGQGGRGGEPSRAVPERRRQGPVGGKPMELLKEKKLPADSFEAAKVLYDVVNGHMKYSKVRRRLGPRRPRSGRATASSAIGTDFHSLFISMARGVKIPSKFEMGFPLPRPARAPAT